MGAKQEARRDGRKKPRLPHIKRNELIHTTITNIGFCAQTFSLEVRRNQGDMLHVDVVLTMLLIAVHVTTFDASP